MATPSLNTKYEQCKTYVRAVALRGGIENRSMSLVKDCNFLLDHGSAPILRKYTSTGNGEGPPEIIEFRIRPGDTTSNFDIRMREDTTISALYEFVSNHMGRIPLNQFRLVWEGVQYNIDEYGGHFLAEVGIVNGSVVHVVLRLAGGCFRTKLDAKIEFNIVANTPYYYKPFIDMTVDFTQGAYNARRIIRNYNGTQLEGVRALADRIDPMIDNCKQNIHVSVHYIAPVLVRRDRDGNIHKWHKHSVLAAARILSRLGIPPEIFSIVWKYLELDPEQYEKPMFEVKMIRMLLPGWRGDPNPIFQLRFEFDETDPQTKSVIDTPFQHFRVDVDPNNHLEPERGFSFKSCFPYRNNEMLFVRRRRIAYIPANNRIGFCKTFHIYPQRVLLNAYENEVIENATPVWYRPSFELAY